VWVQVRPPDPERNDPGEIAEGTFVVSGDLIAVDDNEGRPVATRMLQPGEDPEAVAKRLLRERHGKNAFFGPLTYPNRWVV
jgi:hypothetical protein